MDNTRRDNNRLVIVCVIIIVRIMVRLIRTIRVTIVRIQRAHTQSKHNKNEHHKDSIANASLNKNNMKRITMTILSRILIVVVRRAVAWSEAWGATDDKRRRHRGATRDHPRRGR